MESSEFRLTEQQVNYFNTFGFLSFPGLLADSIAEIIEAFEALWKSKGGGHDGQAHAGVARSCIVPFIDQSERLSALLDDPRIHGIAQGLLGGDYNYIGSDGNYYVGDTSWHSDGWNESIRHMKIALYLDPLTRTSGALRVIPGSHITSDRYSQSLNPICESEELWSVTGSEIPAVALETKPGDVVCFNHNLKHASFGGNQWRRMFTINLSERYPDDKIEDLKNYISFAARFWIDSVYGKTMVATANEERMRHLEQILANQDHLPELTRKARETMSEPARG